MSAPARDKWAEWVLDRQYGGDPERVDAVRQHHIPVRDRVLDGAAIEEGDVVLDVGCGAGLIAFGALERVGESGRVIFSDVSQDLLDHSRALAEEAGVLDRCEFVAARAESLSAIGDASVDAVTTRSVVIYVSREDKPGAFQEFFRVLRPGGRLSMFEPINSFGFPEADDRFFGFDVTPVLPLASKLKDFYDCAVGERTLVDFDERDLVAWAQAAGFGRVELDYTAELTAAERLSWLPEDWNSVLRIAGNPCAPTLEEALAGALTTDEREELESHLRAEFEANRGTSRSALSYLRAVKR